MAARRGNSQYEMGVRLHTVAQGLQPAGVSLEAFIASWQQQYPGVPLQAGSASAVDTILM
jgi:hypothetical protein